MSYIKPGISFQPMTLEASVSASCSNGIDHNTETTCSCEDPDSGDIIFTSVCPIKVDPGEGGVDSCFHVPNVGPGTGAPVSPGTPVPPGSSGGGGLFMS